jgi:hypothetical protein
MGERKDAYKVLVGKPERRRHKRRCEDNIKMNLQEVERESMEWIYLAQERKKVRGACECDDEICWEFLE